MQSIFSTDIILIIDSYKYVAIFFFLLANGVCNIPSSQIVYLAIGYYVSEGKLDFMLSVMFGTAGNVVGNFILSFIISKYGLDTARKFTYINDKALSSFSDKISNNGVLYLTASKLIPNLKIFVPIVVGITKLPFFKSLFIYTVGSALWAIIVIRIGEYFGDSISWQYYTLTVSLLAIVIVSLFYLRFIKASHSK